MATNLTVNGVSRSVPAEPDAPLLYVQRNNFELNGAKFGCGLAQCGACTVLVDGKAVRSCVTANQHGSEKRDHDDRRPRLAKQTAPAATGLHRRAGRPVRLPHQRHDYVGERVARPQPATERARRARGARWQPLPLRYASSHYSRGAAGGAGKREDTNVNGPAFDRREFAIGLGAIVVAFSLDPRLARGQERLPGSLENNRRLDAWIRINAEGTATIFTGKVELGQG